ncbi:hypothetical protein LZF95_24295 [Algoriphagus sp. AGSA1]|uniref:hypothetical protein n=1 Tax=Algoriphagus sp. AGSA1 TaxID=2907213 RepID=UPI001F2EFBBB|nr:hypothetical protein [Algoriphagus sp. AGSA1]MCE7057826.1 hypothetical protein [Algoriphagus sp. AGSA1]
MLKPLYLLLFATVLFTSCKEDEDPIPQSFINGIYENSQQNTDSGLWYVNRYEFNSNGTFDNFQIIRENQRGPDLGYSYHTKGTYLLRGENFSIAVTDTYAVNYEDYPDGYTDSLANLEVQEISTTFRESSGVLRELENGNKLGIVFECNDMLSSIQAMCIGELLYDKVD